MTSNTIAQLYNEYVTYCKERNERPLEANIFGAKLKECGIKKSASDIVELESIAILE
jgi:hypothetical protein